HPRAREGEAHLRREDQLEATGKRHGTLAAAKAPARDVHRSERRGAVRVEDDARTFEPEGVGDATRGAAPRRADGPEQVGIGDAAADDGPVLLAVDSEKDARRRSPQLQGWLPCVVEGFPGCLEADP